MLRLIQCCIEFKDRSEIDGIGSRRRGIYVLYQRKSAHYEVVYVGMTNADMAMRLRSHRRSKRKVWSHFSIYGVWPNITQDEIRELEGLFRHIYRKSAKANLFNVQKGSSSLRKIRVKNFEDWQKRTD